MVHMTHTSHGNVNVQAEAVAEHEKNGWVIAGQEAKEIKEDAPVVAPIPFDSIVIKPVVKKTPGRKPKAK